MVKGTAYNGRNGTQAPNIELGLRVYVYNVKIVDKNFLPTAAGVDELMLNNAAKFADCRNRGSFTLSAVQLS